MLFKAKSKFTLRCLIEGEEETFISPRKLSGPTRLRRQLVIHFKLFHPLNDLPNSFLLRHLRLSHIGKNSDPPRLLRSVLYRLTKSRYFGTCIESFVIFQKYFPLVYNNVTIMNRSFTFLQRGIHD